MIKVMQSIPSGVTIVAVTKTFPFKVVEEAYSSGLRHIGENRVEEAKGKIVEVKNRGFTDIIWHMIGHVQSRKVRDVAELFDWVDSVDSGKIAKKLDSEAGKFGRKLSILLEVNLSGEETKYGFDLVGWKSDRDTFDRFLESVRTIMQLSRLDVCGLMTMPPYVTNGEKNRPIFQSMKRLSNFIRTQIPDFGTQLSMGTSCDYEVAIQEGATQVRLGEALFGKRG